jgi:hypothetical protein
MVLGDLTDAESHRSQSGSALERDPASEGSGGEAIAERRQSHHARRLPYLVADAFALTLQPGQPDGWED